MSYVGNPTKAVKWSEATQAGERFMSEATVENTRTTGFTLPMLRKCIRGSLPFFEPLLLEDVRDLEEKMVQSFECFWEDYDEIVHDLLVDGLKREEIDTPHMYFKSVFRSNLQDFGLYDKLLNIN